jgi:hypothetical protein
MTSYTTRPAGRFFDLVRSMVEYEIKSGNTVSFISEVDLTEVEAIRTAWGRERPSYTACVVKALGMALREFPYANRRLYRRPWWPFGGRRLQQFSVCDVAVACERLNEGIEVAMFIDILRGADALPLSAIHRWLKALAASDASTHRQWRDFRFVATRLPRWLGGLAIRAAVFVPALWARYRGGAALVSSPAKYGIDMVNGSWTAPLGVSFGLVKPRAVVVNGRVVARKTFHFVLNFDRRVMAGAQAARFFKRMVEILENARAEMAADPPPTAERKRAAGGREGGTPRRLEQPRTAARVAATRNLRDGARQHA